MTTALLDFASLGITKEELQDRLVERMATELLRGVSFDEEGNEHHIDSALRRRLNAMVQTCINDTVQRLADEHILPRVSEYVETLTLQETNKWGERRGAPVTFVEYLTQRADLYMREDVNYEGKTREETGGYSWSKSGTRVAFMINRHLHYSIETAMKNALAQANGSIKGGLEAAIKTALESVTSNLKVSIETKTK